MIDNLKKNYNYSINQQESNNIYKCNVSKASSILMLDRICINDQKEFPFLNFL